MGAQVRRGPGEVSGLEARAGRGCPTNGKSLSMLNGMLERIPGQFFSFGSLVKLFVSTLFLSRVARASVELFVTEHESIMQVVIFLLSHSTQLDLALEVLAQSVGLCA